MRSASKRFIDRHADKAFSAQFRWPNACRNQQLPVWGLFQRPNSVPRQPVLRRERPYRPILPLHQSRIGPNPQSPVPGYEQAADVASRQRRSGTTVVCFEFDAVKAHQAGLCPQPEESILGLCQRLDSILREAILHGPGLPPEIGEWCRGLKRRSGQRNAQEQGCGRVPNDFREQLSVRGDPQMMFVAQIRLSQAHSLSPYRLKCT